MYATLLACILDPTITLITYKSWKLDQNFVELKNGLKFCQNNSKCPWKGFILDDYLGYDSLVFDIWFEVWLGKVVF